MNLFVIDEFENIPESDKVQEFVQYYATTTSSDYITKSYSDWDNVPIEKKIQRRIAIEVANKLNTIL